MCLESTYTAIASYQSKTEATSPELCVHKRDRINLHFLRYGLLKDPQCFANENVVVNHIDSFVEAKPMAYSGGPISELPVVQSYSSTYNTSIQFDNKLNSYNKTPRVKNFKSIPMILNAGYLYIIDETENQYHEYLVLENYRGFMPILWAEDNLKDVREPSTGAKVINCIDVKKDNTISVAYSPVQWTRKYMEQMLNNEGGIRDARMKKVKCTGINRSNNEECTKNDIFHVFSIKPHFYSETTGTGTITPSGSCYKMAETLSSVLAIEVAEQAKLGDNNIFEDMFIVLDDATGCASDVSNAIYEKQYALRTLIQQSQCGDGSSTDNMWLMNHTIAFYQLFYRPEHVSLPQIQKLRSAVVNDESFYKKLLAVDERKALRDRIDELRDDLLAIVDSEFYSKAIYNFEQAESDQLVKGEREIQEHHNALVADPKCNDRHLDVISQPSSLKQKINAYMQRICDDQEHSVSKLFAKPVDFDDIANFDLFWFNFQGLASLTAPYVEDIEMLVKHKWFNGKILWRNKAIDGIKENFWVIERESVSNILNRMQMTRQSKYENWFGPGTKGMSGIRVANANAQVEKCVRINVKIDPEKGIFKMNKPLEKIFYCKSFLMLGGMLSALSLMGTIGRFRREEDDWIKAKELVAIAGVTTEIAWFMTKYAERHVAMSKELLDTTKAANTLIGKANVGISVVVSLFDGVSAFRGRDNDAGVAYMGAAICYGVSLFFMTKVGIASLGGASMATGIGVGTLASALSIIALVAAVVLTFIALIYLQDTPIEQYLKNCILNSRAIKIIRNWQTMTPSQLINALVNAKTQIVSNKFDKWCNLKESFEEFILLTSACKVLPEYTWEEYKSIGMTVLAEQRLGALSVENYMPNVRVDSVIQGGFMLVFKSHPTPVETTCRFIEFDKLVAANDVIVKQEDKCIKVRFNNLLSHIETEINLRQQELPQRGKGTKTFESLHKIYLYQRICNQQDDETFPYNDCYLINALKITKARDITTPILLNVFFESALSYDDYCNRRDKTVLTLTKLKELVCSKV